MTTVTSDVAAQPVTSALPTIRLAAVRLVLIAGLLGICANALFVQYPLGVNAPLFALVTLLVLFTLAGVERVRPAWRNAWLAAPLMYFAVMLMVRAEPFLAFLNFCAVLGLALLLIYLFSSGRIISLGVWDYAIAAVISSIEAGLIRPGLVLVAASKDAGKRKPGGVSPRGWAVARGLVLALPIVIIFAMLLTSADIAFNKFILDVLKAVSLNDFPELTLRVMVTGLAGWACLGGLAYALRDAAAQAVARVSEGSESKTGLGNFHLPFTESAIVLGSVNALFAAFVVIQLRYFFGGQSNITVEGFTYAEYARRGFSELVIVALFTLGLGLVLQRLTRRQSVRAVWGFNGLCAILVALTGIILASAFQRLLLYEEAYGFTRLRTYPHVFMIWLGVLLAAFLVTTLLNRPGLFVFSTLLAALGFVATLNTINSDAFIARHNIRRYAETGKLDAVYLTTLSEDALPELVPLLNDPNEETRTVIGGALHYRLIQLTALPVGWPGWHWARARALAWLTPLHVIIEAYEPAQYFWYTPID
jgi:uncharacterized protein DUF4153